MLQLTASAARRPVALLYMDLHCCVVSPPEHVTSRDLAENLPVCPQIMSRLQSRQGAYSEYVELDGIGHVPMDEDPAGFLDALTPFVQRVLQQSSSSNGARAVIGQGEPAGMPETGSGDVLPAVVADIESDVAVDGIASRL